MVIVNRTFDVDAPCINIDNADAATRQCEVPDRQGTPEDCSFILMIRNRQ